MTPALRELQNAEVELSTTVSGHANEKPQTAKPLPEKPSLADRAHMELSELLERSQGRLGYREPFPMNCVSLLHSLPGNRNCVDCPSRDPEWAAVNYGALVCIRCSGKHRSMGVAISQVRSVTLDHWTHREIVNMLEGGNAQLGGFFARNALTKEAFEKQERLLQKQPQPPSGKPRLLTADNVNSFRYKTKAALFYKNQLEAHVGKLLEDPVRKPYKGRSRPNQARNR